MSLDPDTGILERRRLRRRVSFWRVVAVLAIAAAAAIAFREAAPERAHVARLAVSGLIAHDRDREELLRELAETDSVRAVILRIDSPGGSAAGSEALYEGLREIAEAKPLVAVMGEAAASGGYIAALAAERIFARGATLTGSIGVVVEYPNVEELLDRVGVGVDRVASGPLKAEPSPLREPSPEALEASEEVVADVYQWFLDLVAERRGLTAEQVRAVGDGRVFSGRQALAAGLIDEIGGEREALAWLSEEHGLPEDPPVRDAEPERSELGLLDYLLGDPLDGAAAALLAAGPRLRAVLR